MVQLSQTLYLIVFLSMLVSLRALRLPLSHARNRLVQTKLFASTTGEITTTMCSIQSVD
jgi:hypothetical protein